MDDYEDINPLDPKVVDQILNEQLARALEGYYRVHGAERVFKELATWLMAYAMTSGSELRAEIDGEWVLTVTGPDDLPTEEV